MSGCSKDLMFDSNELKQDVIKVEILYYNSPTDSDHIISIEQEDSLVEFIDEFSKLQITVTFGAPGELEGYCIKLFKKDFNYYLITKNHIEHFSE